MTTNIPVLVPTLPTADALLPYLRRIDQSNWYSNNGPLLQEFSRTFASFLSARTDAGGELYVAPVVNGTIAIELALRQRIKHANGVVLMPAYTFVATAHAVANAGFEPFLLDIEEETLALSPRLAKAALATTPNVVAVVAVSPFGGPIDIPAWEAFEAETGIPVVFDAAAAATSLNHIGDQPVCLSLHATKVFAMGEAGAVVSRDEATIKRILGMAGFGFDGPARTALYRGGNYKCSEYVAAMGLAMLGDIERKLDNLQRMTRLYKEGIGNAARLQPGCGDNWVTITTNVVVDDGAVDATLARFDAEGVQWRRWYGEGCHKQPAFEATRRSDLSVTERIARRTIGVPFHEKLSDAQIGKICSLIRG